MDAVDTFCRHALETRFDDLPPQARRAATTFIGDSLGVGVAGSGAPWAEELIAVQAGLGAAAHARVWGRGTALAAPGAAMCNAFQVHNSEFDCVHEAAVVHPMAVLLGAVIAHVERAGAAGGAPVSGPDLMVAVSVGVDVACSLGVASRAGLRFFRPATAGAFGATAAIGRLAGLDRGRLVAAMGIACAQACGTMQAHVEGSPLLAMQVGFNARNAVVACDMAMAGIPGPRDVFEGPFGYLRLFEGDYDLGAVLPELGRTWRIAEVAHKPYPSGRATHGVVDACLALRREHGFPADAIERVAARVPPLTHRLVGRPVGDDMTVSYARLCGAFVAARALLGGGVGLADFDDAARRDPATLALARRTLIAADDNPDPNALTPVAVEIRLRDGAVHACALDSVYGSPALPLGRDAHLAKLRGNLAASAVPLAAGAADRLVALLDDLESVTDVRALVDCLVPGD